MVISSSEDDENDDKESCSGSQDDAELPDTVGDSNRSPLTPTTNLTFSTPHEPARRRCLIECFESLLTLEDTNDADCYDSDGNEPPCVQDEEFEHFEDSIDDNILGEAAAEIAPIQTNIGDVAAAEILPVEDTSKFVLLTDEKIENMLEGFFLVGSHFSKLFCLSFL